MNSFEFSVLLIAIYAMVLAMSCEAAARFDHIERMIATPTAEAPKP